MEDMEAITTAMRPLMAAAGLPITKMGITTFFTNRVRAYLHLVLCFSPIGDAFRQRLRMFPSLVNCCTIDWFREWPDEALRSVATSFYQGGCSGLGVLFTSQLLQPQILCIAAHMTHEWGRRGRGLLIDHQ